MHDGEDSPLLRTVAAGRLDRKEEEEEEQEEEEEEEEEEEGHKKEGERRRGGVRGREGVRRGGREGVRRGGRGGGGGRERENNSHESSSDLGSQKPLTSLQVTLRLILLCQRDTYVWLAGLFFLLISLISVSFIPYFTGI